MCSINEVFRAGNSLFSNSEAIRYQNARNMSNWPFLFFCVYQLIYCNVCCEPFHPFCLEDEERPGENDLENWCCRRCQFCHVCGQPDNVRGWIRMYYTARTVFMNYQTVKGNLKFLLQILFSGVVLKVFIFFF